MSRRTGKLTVPTQVLLEDLELFMKPDVCDELVKVFWPRAKTDFGEQLYSLEEALCACLLAPSHDERVGMQYVVDRLLREPTEADILSRRSIGLITTCNLRDTKKSFRIAGHGGGDWLFERGEALYRPLSPFEVVTPLARTFGLSIELSPGGRDSCRAIPPGARTELDDDDAVARLGEALAARVKATLPGAEGLLERDPLVGFDLALTSLFHLLHHGDVRRQDTQGRRLVRQDYYASALDQLRLGEHQETLRRLIEASHPWRIGPNSLSEEQVKKLFSSNSNSIQLPFLFEATGYITLNSSNSSYNTYYTKNYKKSPLTESGPSAQTVPALNKRWLACDEPLSGIRSRFGREEVNHGFALQSTIDTALGLLFREGQIQGDGLRELREFWEQSHGRQISQRTAEQVVHAARIIESETPGLYADALLQLIDRKRLPELPLYNRVVQVPGYLTDMPHLRETILALWLSSTISMAAVHGMLRDQDCRR